MDNRAGTLRDGVAATMLLADKSKESEAMIEVCISASFCDSDFAGVARV